MPTATDTRPWPQHPGYCATREGIVIGPRGLPVGTPHPKGYLVITVRLPNGRRTTTTAHAIVCEAFHGPPPAPGMDAAHGNGDPTDNRPENLRWATRKQNMADRIDHGTNGRKLTRADVDAIRATPRRHGDRAELAERYGVTPTMISHIRSRRVWRTPAPALSPDIR